MQIVSLTIEDADGKEITMDVPGIYVKDLTYQKELGDIMEIIRVTGDIIALTIGVAIFIFSGNPFAVMIAIGDIGISGIDLYFHARKDHYMKSEYGRTLLKNWEIIYNTVGLGIAVLTLPDLVRGVLNLGLILYRGAIGYTKKFLRLVIFKIILETNIHNFTGKIPKAIDVGREVFKGYRVQFNIAALTRLEEAGMGFVRLIGNSDQTIGFAAIYKGEIIAQGTAKEVRNSLQSVFNIVDNTKLTNALDSLPVYRNFSNARYIFEKFPNELFWKVTNIPSPYKNRARLFGGLLEFDFNTQGIKGLGQKWTEEAFDFFGDRIKTVKAEWSVRNDYPGGQSLGYKEYSEALVKFNGDRTRAAMSTRFYETMSKYGFTKVEYVLEYSDRIIVTIKK